MKQYKISFKLHNGKDITEGVYDGSMIIAQLYNKIKLDFDFFDEYELEMQWIAFSTSTDNYICYSFDTLEQLLPGIQSDIFILQPQGTHGIQLKQWYYKFQLEYHAQKKQLKQDNQLQQLNNLLLEACVSFIEENYQKSIEQYLDVLELDVSNQEAILGLGKCLNALNCPESAIKIYDLVIELEPNNDEAIFQKAKSYNSMKQHQKALSLLENCKKIKQQSYYSDELDKTKQLLLSQQKQ